MKKIFLVLFAATIVLSSCSKKTNNTTPPASTTSTTATVNTAHPVPCFALALNQTSYELINGSANISGIASCSQNAFFYDWDFGDGSPHETTVSIAHSYKKDGKFWIRLRVWNQDKSSSDSSKIQITVGERYLTKITINSINPIGPSGFTWDHGSTAGNINGVNDTIGPDLFVILGSDTANLLSTDTMDVAQVYNNVVTNSQGVITSTPVIWDFSKSTLPTFKNVKLTNYNNWIIQIMDKQYTSSSGGGGSQHMVSKSFNPVVSLGSTSPASLTFGLYKVTFEWVIK